MKKMYENFIELKKKIKQIKLGSYLEFGCGNGAFLGFVLENNNSHTSVTAIDISENAVKEAEKLLGSRDIDFIHYSSLPLPFKNNSFDTITLSNTMHHLEDKTGIFNELKRVLKPDGRVIISEMINTDFTEAEKSHYKFHSLRVKLDNAGNIFHEAAYKEAYLINFFKENGFNIIEKCIIKENKDNLIIPEEAEKMIEFIDELISNFDSTNFIQQNINEIEQVKNHIRKYGIKKTPQLFAVLGK